MDIASADQPSGQTLRFRRRFAASPERVFAAWTRPQALSLWWCPPGWDAVEFVVDLRIGGQYRLAMRRTRETQVIGVHGIFLAIEPPRRLVYTWNWEGAFPDMPPTEVRILLRPDRDGTEVQLRQSPLHLVLCVRHVTGWLHACDRLAANLAPAGAQRRRQIKPTLGVLNLGDDQHTTALHHADYRFHP